MSFLSLNHKTHPNYFKQLIDILYDEWKDLFKRSNLNSKKEVEQHYKRNSQIKFFVLIIDKQLAACYSFVVLKNKLFLCDVVVAKQFRGKGYARKLIEDAFDRARKDNWSNIYLNATTNMLSFYQKYGFVVVKKRKYTNEYRMMKQLLNDNNTFNYITLIIIVIVISIVIWILLH